MKPIITIALTAVLTISFASCRKSESPLKTQNFCCKPSKDIQHILEEEINAQRKIIKPDWTCALVLNERGEIIAGYDTYNSSTLPHLYKEMVIGSLFMPFSILIATRTNLVDSSSVFPFTNFHIRDVIANNSYIGVKRIVYKALSNSKYCEQWCKDNLGELDVISNLSSNRYGYLSLAGVNVITTPAHITWLYHCLAHGLFPEEWHVESSGVLEGLHDCVWNNELGTASVSKYGGEIVYDRAQSDKVAIIGKTGAMMIDNDPYKHIISFVGIFPEDKPQYTCLVMFGNPKGIYCAGVDCGGTVRRIAEQIMTK